MGGKSAMFRSSGKALFEGLGGLRGSFVFSVSEALIGSFIP
jgi:hypothetical protein